MAILSGRGIAAPLQRSMRCVEAVRLSRVRQLLAAALVLAELMSGVADAAPAAPGLSELMAAPLASMPVVGGSGDRIAWIVSQAGRRTVYVAEAPRWRERAAAEFEDDGLELADLTWTSDAQGLLFTRGGDLQRNEVTPTNAALDPIPSLQQIWRVEVAEQSARPLTKGRYPVVAPRSGRITFLRDGDLYLMNESGGEEAKVVEDHGVATVPRWSPDGSRIAFVSQRGTHSFIAVYEPAANRLTYLDPSTDMDMYPVWSPEGGRLAFVRIPADNGDFDTPKRSAEPFSIRIVDVRSGDARELWRAHRGDGSRFMPVAARDQLIWGTTGLLIFPWERTGWLQLYAMPVNGGEPRLLTPGEGEVEHVAATPGGETILYSSNHGDPGRRRIWRVDTQSTNSPTALTPARGIQSSPAPLSNTGAFAYLGSDAQHPVRAFVQQANGATKALGPEPFPFDPRQQLLEPTAVEFPAADGRAASGYVLGKPLVKTGERRPAVVFIHGGPKNQMLPGFHFEHYYSYMYSLLQHLAAHGYVVLSVNFRGGTGYGLAFRETADYGQYGASDLNDIIGAGLYLRARRDVDPERIGLMGGSYGGMMTALGLARASDLFRAGVSIHGVYDMRDQRRAHHPLSVLMRAYDPEQEAVHSNRLAYQSSPLAAVRRWRSPVLLIHGDDDRSVPFFNMVRAVETLRRAGVEHEQLVLPNEGHSFLLYANWLEALMAAVDFLERKL